MRTGLLLGDRLLDGLHAVIALFCLIGWAFPATRSLHLLLVLIIVFCWFGLGGVLGTRYCPLTDLQWRIKKQLGKKPDNSSFVGYAIENLFGIRFNSRQAHRFTEIIFYLVAAISLYMNISAASLV